MTKLVTFQNVVQENIKSSLLLYLLQVLTQARRKKNPDGSKGSKWELTKKTGSFAEAVFRTQVINHSSSTKYVLIVDLEESYQQPDEL